jgi:hypothetical protein
VPEYIRTLDSTALDHNTSAYISVAFVLLFTNFVAKLRSLVRGWNYTALNSKDIGSMAVQEAATAEALVCGETESFPVL